MRNSIRVLALLAIATPIAAPLAAQQQQAKADPTKAVADAPMPDGWSKTFDGHTGSEAAKFITMGPGFHVTSGSAAIYYTSKDIQPNQPYSVTANFRQTAKNVGHGEAGEAFGLIFAGKDLNDPAKQTYFYFLVRQDGKFLINHRAGTEVHKLVEWTPNAAIHKFDDMPNAKNDLTIAVGADSVRFLVNNTEVHALSRANVWDVSGQPGLRVNHNLDVNVANYMVMKGGK
jgi:hypothetical protein